MLLSFFTIFLSLLHFSLSNPLSFPPSIPFLSLFLFLFYPSFYIHLSFSFFPSFRYFQWATPHFSWTTLHLHELYVPLSHKLHPIMQYAWATPKFPWAINHSRKLRPISHELHLNTQEATSHSHELLLILLWAKPHFPWANHIPVSYTLFPMSFITFP